MKSELNYTNLYQLLQQTTSGKISGKWMQVDGMSMWFDSFHSTCPLEEVQWDSEQEDVMFVNQGSNRETNEDFTYPMFVPHVPDANKNCIVLLHGLNERSWNKYLPWGYTLAKNTGKTVILFPIAYHMSRSPQNWNDPRQMLPYVMKRQQKMPTVNMLSVANVALSERLTYHPERFFFSGYQAARDLIQLMDAITSGTHPLFVEGTKVDFFSYSIGTFLNQVLMLGNPGGRFDQSRFLFFCGGSVLEEMQGVSKYILDNKAYERLIHYYQYQFEGDLKQNASWGTLYKSSAELGDAFRSMLSLKSLRKQQEKLFSKFRDRLMAVALKRDRVILPERVKEALRGIRVEELDFNFGYSHEVPFPVRTNNLRIQVNEAFERFMNKAATFFVCPC
jgi:hypothetical protein